MSINDVTVTIGVEKPTPVLGGFGKPLILGSSTAGKPFKNYADLTAVLADYGTSTEEYKAATALFGQENSPAEIAIISRKTGSTPVPLEELLPTLFLKDWHFLLTTSTTLADLILIGDAVEADNSRQFFARTNSKEDAAAIKAKNYDRTYLFYHTTVTNYPESAWVGAVGSLPVGSVIWKAWTLKGILPLDIDATELNAIHALGANTYVTKAGTNVTSAGQSVSGEFIDFVHSKDYIVNSVQYAVQDLFNKAQLAKRKIPFTNSGIAEIESAVRTVLQRSYLQGMIAADDDNLPLYNTTFPPRSQIDAGQIAARNYPDGQFDFIIAGGIEKGAIRGTIKFV